MKLVAAITAFFGSCAVLTSTVSLSGDIPRVAREFSLEEHPAGLREDALNIPSSINDTQLNATNDHNRIEYNGIWAGAALAGENFKIVTGTFTAPIPKIPAGGNSGARYSASIWVGLDGITCQGGLLQAGIDLHVQDGIITCHAWYEWWPDRTYYFDLAISAGNSLTVDITTTSSSSGSVSIINHSTGETGMHNFSREASELCGTNAEWIVEALSHDGPVPFLDFGTVTFTKASVTTTSGSIYGVSDATIYGIKHGGKVLTRCGTTGNSTVFCTYI